MRQFKSCVVVVVSKPFVMAKAKGNNDLGLVAASTVSDPGPCCCDWLRGGGWRVCMKPWQSGPGRRHYVGASGMLTCTQSVTGGVTAAFPNGALRTAAGQSWLEGLERST